MPPDIRAKLTADLKAKRQAAARGDGGATPNASGKGGKGAPSSSKGASKAAPAKGDPKPKGKAEPEETDDDAEETEAEDEDPVAATKRAKRDLAKIRRRSTALQAEDASRRSQLDQAERAFVQRRDQTIAQFKADPVAWLRENKVDVKKTLSDWVSEDGADPRDKAIKEAKETAEEAKKKLEDREKREQAEEAERRKAEGRAQVAREIGKAWEAADADEYPTLALMYERDEIAEMGMHMAVEVYARTRTELGPAEIFATLEETLREQDDATTKRKQRRDAKATEDTNSEPPDRVRSVARSKSESPQARPARAAPRAADVSNRETRQVAEEGRSRVNRDALRERLVGMTRERLQR